jgi:hypothetical protein
MHDNNHANKKGVFGIAAKMLFAQNLNFFWLKINFLFVFLNCFDVLISKMNFKKNIYYFDAFLSEKHNANTYHSQTGTKTQYMILIL